MAEGIMTLNGWCWTLFILAELIVLLSAATEYEYTPKGAVRFVILHFFFLLVFAGGLDFYLKTGEFLSPGGFFGALGGIFWLSTVALALGGLIYRIWDSGNEFERMLNG